MQVKLPTGSRAIGLIQKLKWTPTPPSFRRSFSDTVPSTPSSFVCQSGSFGSPQASGLQSDRRWNDSSGSVFHSPPLSYKHASCHSGNQDNVSFRCLLQLLNCYMLPMDYVLKSIRVHLPRK